MQRGIHKRGLSDDWQSKNLMSKVNEMASESSTARTPSSYGRNIDVLLRRQPSEEFEDWGISENTANTQSRESRAFEYKSPGKSVERKSPELTLTTIVSPAPARENVRRVKTGSIMERLRKIRKRSEQPGGLHTTREFKNKFSPPKKKSKPRHQSPIAKIS